MEKRKRKAKSTKTISNDYENDLRNSILSDLDLLNGEDKLKNAIADIVIDYLRTKPLIANPLIFRYNKFLCGYCNQFHSIEICNERIYQTRNSKENVRKLLAEAKKEI